MLPQVYDQHYWADRVEQLGIGAAHPQREVTTDSLSAALGRALEPTVADRAAALPVRTDGTLVAAQSLADRSSPVAS